jgi:hypothetical protein
MTAPVTYHGHNRAQLKDGGPCPGKDCVPCSHATGTDAATAGAWQLTGPGIRSAAHVSCTTGTGGLTQQQAADGVKSATSGEVVWTVYYDLDRQQVVDHVRSYGPLEISLAYRRILSYSFRNSTTFTGGHGTLILEFRKNPTTGVLECLWDDPLADARVMADGKHAHIGPQWVRADVILAASEDRGGGPGQINVSLAPDSRYAAKKARSSTPLRALPSGNAEAIATLPTGTSVRAKRPVNGASWVLDGISGSGWWEIDQVAGVAVSTKYPGHTVLYAVGPRLRAA